MLPSKFVSSRPAKKTRLRILTALIRELFPDLDFSAKQPVESFENLTYRERRKIIWLTIYVLSGVMPTLNDIEDAELVIHSTGMNRWFNSAGEKWVDSSPLRFEIVREQTIVDVFHTSRARLLTGIQRVVWETTTRWAESNNILLAAWDDNWKRLRVLDAPEAKQFGVATSSGLEQTALIPINCTYQMIELVADPIRVSRLAAMVDCGLVSLQAVVYDCVPISSSETTAQGMSFAFANYLDLVSRASRITPISAAAAAEYQGWKTALQATGLDGPEIIPIDLAAEVEHPSSEEQNSFFAQHNISPNIPLIVCVGSQEPRKNHLSVLRAAESLWNEGLEFQLIFIGGNSWGSQLTEYRLNSLIREGRPVQQLTRLSDRSMYSAVARARFTIFPSLNEGFGLPVAESLLLGTPVITSNYGSTKHIADGNGGYLVNPRDDLEVRESMRQMLTNDALLKKLKMEASSFTWKTWDEYANETWQALNHAH